jgi:HSP20 family protein
MLSRYSFPLAPLNELRREMDRLLDEFGLGSWRMPWDTAPYPALNIWDDGDAFCVEAELPGVRQEDIEVYAVGNELTIKGRRVEPEGSQRTYHRQERGTGEFARVVTLPAEVDAEKVEANLKDGVLTLRLPKAESARPRKIVVKTR